MYEDVNIIFGASIDEVMGDAIKAMVIAIGFDAQTDEIPVEIAAPARAVASPPTRREAMRETLREGFGTAAASRTTFSTSRPVAPPMEMTSVSTRRPAALAASLQASSPMSSSMPEVRQRITFPAGIDGDADWDTPAFQRRGGG